MTPIISARELSKTFHRRGGGEVVAVRDLTMDITPGSLTAFLGPNGAGKSTSLRMLTTLLPPTSGSATVCGHDIATEPDAVRRSIGYIGQKNGAAQYYRVRDELVSQGAFYRLDRTERRRRADELIEVLDLGELATRTTMSLSGGQRRRVDIALGLVPAPPLLFLDEPTTGLDPQSRAHLWDHILTLRERYGMTIFLTTHYLEEADHFAERVMIVDQGRLIADDTAARLKADLAGDRIVLTVTGAEPDDDVLAVLRRVTLRPDDIEHTRLPHPSPWDGRPLPTDSPLPTERSLPTDSPLPTDSSFAGSSPVTGRGAPGHGPATGGSAGGPAAVRYVVVVDHGDRVLPGLLGTLAAGGHRVLAAELHQPTLDDVFLALTGRSLREEETVPQDAPTPAPAAQPAF